MNELRRFPRLRFACDIEYSITTPDAVENQESMVSKTKNVSLGGICLVTDSALETGDILTLRIRLKGFETPIEVLGRVVWTQTFDIGEQKGYDNGIEFIKIPEAHRAKLEEFMQKTFTSSF